MRYRDLRHGPIARVLGSLAVVMAMVLSFMGNAFASDPEYFKVWHFSSETPAEHLIQVPADGYIGIYVKYAKPQDITEYFHMDVTVYWPPKENGWPDYGRAEIEKIRKYIDVEPATVLFDDNTPVLAGNFFYIEVYPYLTNPIYHYSKFPYELTVFWERAYPEADQEDNSAFDKPLDLGIISVPFEFSSHIGFQKPWTFRGASFAGGDTNDYFKFKVKDSGYYVISYASANDWGVDTSLRYCRPVVSGLFQEDAYSGNYISPKWFLKEKDHIGPYYLLKENTYYLDLQSEHWTSYEAPYECNASVLFMIKGGYTNYWLKGMNDLPWPDTVKPGELVRRSYILTNTGTIEGNPVVVRMKIQSPSGQIVYTAQQSISIDPHNRNEREIVFDWKIPKSYKNEGIHNINVEVLENNKVVDRQSQKLIVLKNIPPVTAIINLLLTVGLQEDTGP
jgi:hypothetical protein